MFHMVALSLIKEIHWRLDSRGEMYDLHYLRNKQKQEVDFLITKNRKPHLMIEVKETDSQPSHQFEAFAKYWSHVPKLQLVRQMDKGFKSKAGVTVTPAAEWLAKMDF